MRAKTSAVLMLPPLTILAASLQAADMNPSWVEYTPVSASPASDTSTPTAPAASIPAPVAATPASATEATPATPASTPAAATAQPGTVAAATEATSGRPVAVAGSAAASAGDVEVASVLTPRVFAFDYSKGVGQDKTHYLERYDYREAFDGDTRSGLYADLDLDIDIRNQDRQLFRLERRGFGPNNHRGTARFDDDEITLSGEYSHYRSATGGIDYLFNPNLLAPGAIPGGDYTVFNDDGGTFDYHVDRTTYGASFKMKPPLLGGATLSLDYEGYKREGNKFGAIFIDAPAPVAFDDERWRGLNLAIDERMNRMSFNISASPKDMFTIAYEASYEQFINNVPELQLQRDVWNPAGIPGGDQPPGGGPKKASVYYVPDANMLSQAVRFSKNFDDRFLLAAGYSFATLKGDSFTQWEIDEGHDKNEINTNSAYVNLNAVVSTSVNVEGYIKYYNRDNDSTYPDGLIGTGPGSNRLVSPRIDSIESIDYGLAANWRPGVLGSTVTLGWHRLDRERDLTWGIASGEDILPPQSLYREDTLSDEIYLKWIARPARGWTVRLSPSYTWADDTGLITEPEEALKVHAMVSYAAPTGWLVSGYYDYRHKQNANNTFTDAAAPDLTYSQDTDSTLHSAGLTLNVMPLETVNAFANLFWIQDDLSSYLFRTNEERWTGNVVFTLVDRPNYKIDTYGLGLGADWQASDKLRMSGSYSYTHSKGDVASGSVLTALQDATGTVDSRIDNNLHSVSLGADYSLSDTAKLRANYIYDYYDDNAYSLLTGGVHTLAVGVSFKM